MVLTKLTPLVLIYCSRFVSLGDVSFVFTKLLKIKKWKKIYYNIYEI